MIRDNYETTRHVAEIRRQLQYHHECVANDIPGPLEGRLLFAYQLLCTLDDTNSQLRTELVKNPRAPSLPTNETAYREALAGPFAPLMKHGRPVSNLPPDGETLESRRNFVGST